MTCKSKVSKNQLVNYLESHGVQTRMLFSGNLTRQPCFDEMRKNKVGYHVIGELSNTDRIMEDTFWIGVYPGMTESMLDYMAEQIRDAIRSSLMNNS